MNNFHKKYIVLYEHYDYFGGQKEEREIYSTATEVVKKLKYNYYFDDGSYSRRKIINIKWEYETPNQPKHGLVLGYQPNNETTEPSSKIGEDLFPDLDEGLPF